MFLRACPAWWRPYFTVALWTGARPNELAALKWGDVDAPGAQFRIRAGRYRGKEGTPKTAGSVRDVDMLPPVVEAFRAQRAQQAAQRLRDGQGALEPGKDHVFTGRTGGFLNPDLHARQGLVQDARARPSSGGAPSTRRATASRRMRWPRASRPRGSRPSSGTRRPRCCSRSYARFIPNRTRRDGSALLARMRRYGEFTGRRAARAVTRVEDSRELES